MKKNRIVSAAVATVIAGGLAVACTFLGVTKAIEAAHLGLGSSMEWVRVSQVTNILGKPSQAWTELPVSRRVVMVTKANSLDGRPMLIVAPNNTEVLSDGWLKASTVDFHDIPSHRKDADLVYAYSSNPLLDVVFQSLGLMVVAILSGGVLAMFWKSASRTAHEY